MLQNFILAVSLHVASVLKITVICRYNFNVFGRLHTLHDIMMITLYYIYCNVPDVVVPLGFVEG